MKFCFMPGNSGGYDRDDKKPKEGGDSVTKKNKKTKMVTHVAVTHVISKPQHRIIVLRGTQIRLRATLREGVT